MDKAKRGFSYLREGPLDMRMGNQELTAKYIINHYKIEDLAMIFKNYGQEPFFHEFAVAIGMERKKQPIQTTKQLVDIIRNLWFNNSTNCKSIGI